MRLRIPLPGGLTVRITVSPGRRDWLVLWALLAAHLGGLIGQWEAVGVYAVYLAVTQYAVRRQAWADARRKRRDLESDAVEEGGG